MCTYDHACMCVCEGVRGSSTSAAGILVLTGVHYAFLDRFFVCFKMQVRRWDVTTGINTDTYNGSFFVCLKMQVRRWDVTTGINTDTYNGSFFVCLKMQVRRWDVTTGINTDTYNGSKAVYAVACPEKGTSQPSAPGACEPASQRGLGTSRRAKVDK